MSNHDDYLNADRHDPALQGRDLPELPEPRFLGVQRGGLLVEDGYSEEQMEDYATKAYAEGRKDEAELSIGIEDLQAMYDAQCACTDEWADKYRAEVGRKADATLLARIADLEGSLAAVNERLAQAQSVLSESRAENARLRKGLETYAADPDGAYARFILGMEPRA